MTCPYDDWQYHAYIAFGLALGVGLLMVLQLIYLALKDIAVTLRDKAGK